MPYQLVPVLARAYLEQFSDAKSTREEITSMLLQCKSLISLLSTSRRDEVSLHAGAVALRMVGTLYSLSSALPHSNKAHVYMAEVAPVFATLFLALARNGFRSLPKSDDEIAHWMHDVPDWLRGVALVSAAQIMLAHEGVAKRLMPSLIQSGLSLHTAGVSQPQLEGKKDPLILNLAFVSTG